MTRFMHFCVCDINNSNFNFGTSPIHSIINSRVSSHFASVFTPIRYARNWSHPANRTRSSWHAHLLNLEDVLVEILLQLLVGIIDAKLLKRVLLKNFKAKYVQHSDGVSLRRKCNTEVKQNHMNWFYVSLIQVCTCPPSLLTL